MIFEDSIDPHDYKKSSKLKKKFKAILTHFE